MKHIKKLAALVVTLVMVLMVSAVAMAADSDDQGNLPPVPQETNQYIFEKQIKVTGTGTIYMPSATYSYAVSTGVPIEGPTDGAPSVSASQIAFSKTDAVQINDGSTSGEKVITKEGIITITYTDKTRAGVYKYTITESLAENNSGITVDKPSTVTAYNNTRTLVVVVANDANTNALYTSVVYLYKEDKGEQTVADKTAGWDVIENESFHKYETTTVRVTKVITGAYADKTHAFPFTIALNNASNGSRYTYVKGTTSDTREMNESVAISLANNESIELRGVPANMGTTATIKESNDTNSPYTVETAGLSNDLGAGTTISTDASVGTGGETSAITPTTTNNITFTNTLRDMSATGLVLRVAPYALAVAGGVAFFVISRRRNEEVA